jgi:hypothetical protein
LEGTLVGEEGPLQEEEAGVVVAGLKGEAEEEGLTQRGVGEELKRLGNQAKVEGLEHWCCLQMEDQEWKLALIQHQWHLWKTFSEQVDDADSGCQKDQGISKEEME